MLKIYLDICDVPKDVSIINDVEKEFAKTKIKGYDIERNLIKYIEKGTFLDEYSFIDRFGYKLRITELSTGCKAALCVQHCPDSVVDLIECGLNARDVIVSICKNGSVLLHGIDVTIADYVTSNIDVQCNGYIFNTIDRLNYYIKNEYPYKPDMSKEGVNYVSN